MNFEMYFADISEYPVGVFIPVPTAVAPNAISDKWSNEFFKEFNPCFIWEL